MTTKSSDGLARFFAYARTRHQIYLTRATGAPKPWTDDPILRVHKFTNVYRELDRTTAWFREKVREPMRSRPGVLLATVLFRLLNRVEVGEAIFCQSQLFSGESAFEEFLDTRDIRAVRRAVHAFVGRKGPHVTGAYIISSPPGYTKLDGILSVVKNFDRKSEWRDVARLWINGAGARTMEELWDWLREQPYLGHFHSYEVVTDLRHTCVLSDAPDKLTWCNVGPGARRGLNRVHRGLRGREANARIGGEQALEEIRGLLTASRDARFWPQGGRRTAAQAQIAADWPSWEMREVEHTLCEFDKYERVRLGEGRPRGKFDGE